MAIQWKGVFPALTTPFTEKDEIDLGLFKKTLAAQLEAGVKGIVLGGTLGEASVLSTDEKEQLVRSAVDWLQGKLPVIINIAEGSTKEALKQIELATDWGAS